MSDGSTTIKSTSLDFTAIKNNLKTFLANKPEFADYNFESSALSNILDVLAWNTHYNGLTANFALNESFLSTAQLRSSLVSLAQGIGYIPKSKTASRAVVRLGVDLTDVPGRPPTISLPANTKFNSVIDDVVYTFYTREALIASENNGYYQFATADGGIDVSIYEGQVRTKTFIIGPYEENAIYIIPDKDMDTSTAIVKVFEDTTTTAFATYKNIIEATVINNETTLYILKESPNGYHELSFGEGVTLGKSPDAGNKVEVEYLRTNGVLANNGKVFTAANVINVNGTNYNLSVTTVSNSIGGDDKESSESIRKNAPFQYATQNRMVTAADYSSLILRNFGTTIKDIKSWGGEDDLEPRFGAVYISIVFNDDVNETQINNIKQSITDLSEQLSIVSFDILFKDPVETFIETKVFFQFNPQLTTLSLNTIQSQVNSVVNEYFNDTVGKFNAGFRRSNLLTEIDEVSPSVLSSRAEIKMQQRISPIPGLAGEFSLRYPTPIAEADDKNYVVTSTPFVYQNKNCIIRNRLESTKLSIISLSDDTVIVDNIGEYNPANSRITITGLNIDAFLSGVDYIKISAVPANQSSIEPKRNDLLKFDSSISFSSAEIYSSI